MIAKRYVMQKKHRPLGFHSSLHLTMAANWLALGQIEEAATEFSQLPARARSHPQAAGVCAQLSASLPERE
jgi:thioredoxin-like negative regulator of GroEL